MEILYQFLDAFHLGLAGIVETDVRLIRHCCFVPCHCDVGSSWHSFSTATFIRYHRRIFLDAATVVTFYAATVVAFYAAVMIAYDAAAMKWICLLGVACP